MAHSPELRQAVRTAYVHDRLSLEAAAEAGGVPHSTARTWKARARAEGDDWDSARNAARLAEGGLGDLTRLVIGDFARLFQATMEGLKNYQGDPVDAAQALTRLADSYVKMVGAAGRAEPGVTRQGMALEVLRLLSDFIRRQYPQHLATFAGILEPFGAHLQTELKRRA